MQSEETAPGSFMTGDSRAARILHNVVLLCAIVSAGVGIALGVLHLVLDGVGLIVGLAIFDCLTRRNKRQVNPHAMAEWLIRKYRFTLQELQGPGAAASIKKLVIQPISDAELGLLVCYTQSELLAGVFINSERPQDLPDQSFRAFLEAAATSIVHKMMISQLTQQK